ncbi:MAG: mechanosensitive ion channel family protein [Pseudomonadota bacterium]
MQSLIESLSVGAWQHWMPALKTTMRVLAIIIVAWLLYQFIHRLIQQFRIFMALKTQGTEEIKRIETLTRVFRYTATVAITVIAGMLILTELGMSIAPILGAAGVVGVAVGFGAQSLVKDYFTGLFLLLENQIRQGDVVDVAGKSGEVEEITLRYMRLRDGEGAVHYIPNSLVTTVTNRTRDFAYAVIDIGIDYKENIDDVLDIMRAVSRDLRNTPDFGPKILTDIEIDGVEKLGDSAVTLRGRIKTPPLEQWSVKREFLKRLKAALDVHNVEIPLPHMTLRVAQDKDRTSQANNVVPIPKGD